MYYDYYITTCTYYVYVCTYVCTTVYVLDYYITTCTCIHSCVHVHKSVYALFNMYIY